MDVDNGPADGSGVGGVDIEQSLLQQFSCMGTTDREDLIKELQRVLGNHLNYATAAFFLDMNNWQVEINYCSKKAMQLFSSNNSCFFSGTYKAPFAHTLM